MEILPIIEGVLLFGIGFAIGMLLVQIIRGLIDTYKIRKLKEDSENLKNIEDPVEKLKETRRILEELNILQERYK